jgi:hypothetical protein
MTMPNLEIQIISSIGALLCLLAYVGHQLKWMDSRRALFNLLNLLGGGILVYAALHPFQLGFLIMEVSWAAISLYALIKCVYIKDKT